MPKEKSCETCRYWRTPDPTGRIGNVGMCSALTQGPYVGSIRKEPEIVAPFWTRDLTHLTTSWEGDHCRSYKRKAG
jgi:hypothetical protein